MTSTPNAPDAETQALLDALSKKIDSRLSKEMDTQFSDKIGYRVTRKIDRRLGFYAGIFGIANLLALGAAAVYLFVFLPSLAVDEAVKRYDKQMDSTRKIMDDMIKRSNDQVSDTNAANVKLQASLTETSKNLEDSQNKFKDTEAASVAQIASLRQQIENLKVEVANAEEAAKRVRNVDVDKAAEILKLVTKYDNPEKILSRLAEVSARKEILIGHVNGRTAKAVDGSFASLENANGKGGQKCSLRIDFPRPFAEPPEVLVAVRSFRMDTRGAGSVGHKMVYVRPEILEKDHFIVDVWVEGGTILLDLDLEWMASGTFAQK